MLPPGERARCRQIAETDHMAGKEVLVMGSLSEVSPCLCLSLPEEVMWLSSVSPWRSWGHHRPSSQDRMPRGKAGIEQL